MPRPATILLVFGIAVATAEAQPYPLGPPFQINIHTSGDQALPAISAFDDGEFVVVWESPGQDGDGLGVVYRFIDAAGLPSGAEFLANESTAFDQRVPDVAASRSGTFLVAWQTSNVVPGTPGAKQGIYARGLDRAGAPPGADFRLNQEVRKGVHWTRVAWDDSRDLMAVWKRAFHDEGDPEERTGYQFMARVFGAGGRPRLDEFPIHRAARGYTHIADVGMDALGRSVVTWEQGSKVLARRFDRRGGPIGGTFRVYPPGEPEAYRTAADARVAVDETGAFVIVYSVLDAARKLEEVHARRYDRFGAPLGTAITLSLANSAIDDLSVAMDDAGRLAVAWQAGSQMPTGGRIVTGVYRANGTVELPETPVNDALAHPGSGPAVAMDCAGGFTVVWTDHSNQDGSGRGIFGRSYAPSNPAACRTEEAVVTSPPDAVPVECPGHVWTWPLVQWDPGRFERFRVQISADPSFPKGSTSGSGADSLETTGWQATRDAWRSACAVAMQAPAGQRFLHLRVIGEDLHVPPDAPSRREASAAVRLPVQP